MEIVLMATLRGEAGVDRIKLDLGDKAPGLREVLREARKRLMVLRRYIDDDGRPILPLIILVDGKDYRLLGKNLKIQPDSVVTIIPVIHGG